MIALATIHSITTAGLLLLLLLLLPPLPPMPPSLIDCVCCSANMATDVAPAAAARDTVEGGGGLVAAVA